MPQLQAPKSPEEKKKSAIKDWGRYGGLAFQLLGACLIGVLAGRWLDAKMGLERPLFAVFLTIFLMVASLVSLYYQLTKNP